MYVSLLSSHWLVYPSRLVWEYPCLAQRQRHGFPLPTKPSFGGGGGEWVAARSLGAQAKKRGRGKQRESVLSLCFFWQLAQLAEAQLWVQVASPLSMHYQCGVITELLARNRHKAERMGYFGGKRSRSKKKKREEEDQKRSTHLERLSFTTFTLPKQKTSS